MLGLSSGLIKGASVLRSIVKSGLQAWYKADKTQAPVGEEQVVNGSFLTGPEILPAQDLSPFADGTLASAVGFTNSSAAVQVVTVQGRKGFRIQTSGSIVALQINDALTIGKSYILKYEVLEHNTGNIQAAGWDTNYDGTTEDPTLPNSVGVQEVLLVNKSNIHSHFSIKRHSSGSALDIVITNVSLKQVNPNDSWNTNTGVGSWTFKDGFAEFDKSLGTTYIGVNSLLAANTKYKLSFAVEGTSPNLAIYRGNTDALINYTAYSTGNHEVEFTVGGVGGDFRIFGHGINSSDFTITNISLRKVTNSVKDFSSNSNDATLNSGIALDFAGTADNIDLGILNSTAINTSTKLTIALWFNADAMADDMMFSTGQDGANRFYLWTLNSELQLGFGTNLGTTAPGVGTQPAIEANRWYRAVIVVDGLTAIVYLDGEFKYIKKSAAFTTEDSLHLGQHANEGTPYSFNGQIADFQVYEKAWTASDVEFDYNNPDKDVFDDQNRNRVITDSLIPSIESSGFGSGLGNSNAWGAQALNDNWDNGSGDAQLYSKSGDSITFGSINGTARLYPAHVTDTINSVVTSSDAITSGNTYVIKYTVLNKVGDPNLTIYAGTLGDYVAIPTSVGTHEFQFVHKGTNRSSNPLKITTNGTSITISNFSMHRVLTHKSQVSETDCEALYRLNEGAGNEVYNAAPIIRGEEIITNGDFTTAGTLGDASYPLGWAKNNAGSDVSIANGELILFNSAGSANDGRIYATDGSSSFNVVTNDRLYKLTYTISEVSGGTPDLQYHTGGSYVDFTAAQQTVGTHTKVYKSTGTIFLLRQIAAGVTVKVSNVSIKEITPATNVAQASWVASNWVKDQPYIPQYAMSSYSKKLLFEKDTRLIGDLPTSMLNQAPNNFTLSIWYMPTSSTGQEVEGETADRRTLFGLLRDLNANVTGTFTYQSFSFEHWADNTSNDGEDIYLWSGDGTASGAVNATNYKSIKVRSDFIGAPGELKHYAINVTTSGQYTVYENGIKISGPTTPSWLDTSTDNSPGTYDTVKKFLIGNRADSGLSLPLEGIVDEISLFKKPLSETEIQEIFNSGTALDVRNHSRCLYELINNRDVASSQSLTGYNEMTSNTTQPDITLDSGGVRLTNNSDADSGSNANDGKMNVSMNEGPHLMLGVKYTLSYDVVENADGAVLQIWKGDGYINVPNGSVVGPVSHTFTPTAINSTGFFFKQSTQGKSIVINNISLKAHFLSGYWRNDGGKQNWVDLSTYGNNAVITTTTPNDIQFQEVPLFGKDSLGFHMNRLKLGGLNFDGNGYARIKDDPSFGNFSNAFTCCYWYRHFEDVGVGGDVVPYAFTVCKGSGLSSNVDNGFASSVYNNVVFGDVNTKLDVTGISFNSGDTTINCTSTAGITPGMKVAGTGIPTTGGPKVGTVITNTSFALLDTGGSSLATTGNSDGSLTLNGRYTASKSVPVATSDNPVWYYVAIAYSNGQKVKLYIDDVAGNIDRLDTPNLSNYPVAGSFTATAESRDITIGANATLASNRSRSVIDDVKFYNRELTAKEIKKNYNATKGRHRN